VRDQRELAIGLSVAGMALRSARPPQEWDGDMIGAFSIAIGEGFLPAYRAQYGVPEDILIPQKQRAA
jgi:hypothetical protein